MSSRADVAPLPLPFWIKITAAMVPTLLLIGTLIWGIAQYPDRDEFNATVDAQKQRLKEIRDDLSELQGEVQKDLSQLQLNHVKVRADIEAIRASGERQERELEGIGRKLDRVLEGRRGRK